uniref:MADS box interactor-like n=1 Tax=Arundo donax TaxID=35708 RepID=A0A0A9D706_ARUDO
MQPSPPSRRSPEAGRVRKRALEQVQRAIEMLRDADTDLGVPLSKEEDAAGVPPESEDSKGGVGGGGHDGDGVGTSSVASDSDHEAAQLCDLLKSKVESLEFLQMLDGTQKSVYQNGAVEPDTSWDIIKAVDLWKDDDSDDGYVLVKQEDVVDGITSFMAAYLLSLKKTKDLSPNQLQKALHKTFATQKKKSKIRKAWDGTKVIYNVASWGATAVGMYNNRALLTVATTAFRASFRVISKFL